MATGWVWDERYAWHDTGSARGSGAAGRFVEPGPPFFENANAKRRMRNLVDVSGLLAALVEIPARPATEEELLRVHTAGYVARVRAASSGDGDPAAVGTPLGAGSFEIALLAAGGALALVDALLDGTVENGYALVRPPGHHAEAGAALGFCIFANTALAARHAQVRHGVERVAIVDWDVHHGNGTEDAFEADPSVLTISLHGEDDFPRGRGRARDAGSGPGTGFNVNVPLPPGSGAGAYLAAMERVVLPALHRFGPDLILVASGLDASAYDPLGRMLLHSDAYRTMTALVMEAAATLCGGRVACIHEGGYSDLYAPFCGLAVVETLAGRRSEVADPFLADLAGGSAQALQPHQEEAIAAVAAAVERARGAG